MKKKSYQKNVFWLYFRSLFFIKFSFLSRVPRTQCSLKPYESDSDDEDYNVDFDESKLPPIEIPPGDHKLQVNLN
jgi:hypothetical protein